MQRIVEIKKSKDNKIIEGMVNITNTNGNTCPLSNNNIEYSNSPVIPSGCICTGTHLDSRGYKVANTWSKSSSGYNCQ